MKFSFRKYTLKKKSTSYIYRELPRPSWIFLNTQPCRSPTSTPPTYWNNWDSLPTPFFSSLNPVSTGHIFIGVGSPTTACSTYLACLPEGSRLSLCFSSSSLAGTPALWPPFPVSLRFWVCFWTQTEEVVDDFIFIGSRIQHLGCVPLLDTHFLGYLSPLCLWKIHGFLWKLINGSECFL